MRSAFSKARYILSIAIATLAIGQATAQTSQPKMKAAPAPTSGYDLQKSIKPVAEPPQTTKGYDQQRSVKQAP